MALISESKGAARAGCLIALVVARGHVERATAPTYGDGPCVGVAVLTAVDISPVAWALVRVVIVVPDEVHLTDACALDLGDHSDGGVLRPARVRAHTKALPNMSFGSARNYRGSK